MSSELEVKFLARRDDLGRKGKQANERKREQHIRLLSKYAKQYKNTSCTTDVYECSRSTARLVIPRDRTPLRSFSTRSRSSSLHTSRESPVLPEGHQHTHRDYQDYFKLYTAFRQSSHVCASRMSLHSYIYNQRTYRILHLL